MTGPPDLRVVAPGLRRWLSSALDGWSGSLESERLEPLQVGAGRGPVGRARLGGVAAVVRRYRRGGLLARILPDRFLGARRAIREIEALERLAPLGLAPRPLALEASGGLLCALRIAVEEIHPATNLLDGARSGAIRLDAEMGRRIGALVSRMHEAGVSHRDLNVGNLLVQEAPGARRVLVVDLDGARCFDGAVPWERRTREVLRLCRSVDKWQATAAAPASARAAFLRAALPVGLRGAVLKRARRRARVGRSRPG